MLTSRAGVISQMRTQIGTLYRLRREELTPIDIAKSDLHRTYTSDTL